MIIAYLEPVRTTPAIALQRAFSAFRQREGTQARWAIAGEGVELPPRELQRLGLHPGQGQARPGHVLVGIDTTPAGD